MVNLLKNLRPFQNYNFNNTVRNPFFFTFLNIGRNPLILIFLKKYGHSYIKSAFGMNFGLWEVVKL